MSERGLSEVGLSEVGPSEMGPKNNVGLVEGTQTIWQITSDGVVSLEGTGWGGGV